MSSQWLSCFWPCSRGSYARLELRFNNLHSCGTSNLRHWRISQQICQNLTLGHAMRKSFYKEADILRLQKCSREREREGPSTFSEVWRDKVCCWILNPTSLWWRAYSLVASRTGSVTWILKNEGSCRKCKCFAISLGMDWLVPWIPEGRSHDQWSGVLKILRINQEEESPFGMLRGEGKMLWHLIEGSGNNGGWSNEGGSWCVQGEINENVFLLWMNEFLG